mmetsp:Transcript_13227/g.24270  ORF Transcript_13227/g.24270 Transcript_13227/m.24270 type:complete len:85 (-) Transcript_13227:22-276(-)
MGSEDQHQGRSEYSSSSSTTAPNQGSPPHTICITFPSTLGEAGMHHAKKSASHSQLAQHTCHIRQHKKMAGSGVKGQAQVNEPL